MKMHQNTNCTRTQRFSKVVREVLPKSCARVLFRCISSDLGTPLPFWHVFVELHHHFSDSYRPMCTLKQYEVLRVFELSVWPGENWNTVMYDGMRATGWWSTWRHRCVCTFVFTILLCILQDLNRLISIRLSTFRRSVSGWPHCFSCLLWTQQWGPNCEGPFRSWFSLIIFMILHFS